MQEEFCLGCNSFPCTCLHKDFATYIVGTESTQFIGFQNLESENNCFLSTSLQALFNTVPFTEMLQESCPESDLCTICCLKSLNSEISTHRVQNSNQINLSPYRTRLSQLCGNGRFNEGEIGDSMEAIEVLLFAIHTSSTLSASSEIFDTECQEECHAHSICYNYLVETYTCPNNHCSSRANISMSFIVKLDSGTFFRKVPERLENLFKITLNKDLNQIYEKSQMKELVGTFPGQVKKQLVSGM